jgi:hypothetical protein
MRCLVKVYHKYDFFQMSVNEMTDTGIVIHKNDDYIMIVTAFHVIIPQYVLTFNEIVILNIFTLISILFSWWYIKLNMFNYKLFICALLYSLLCCVLVYGLLAICYPLLCISSFEIQTVNSDVENRLSSQGYDRLRSFAIR